MLLPADAMPRETRRRTTRWRDRRKERERDRALCPEEEGVVGGGRGQVGSERNERSGMEVERGKSSVRSTIFPSRRAVTFYLASFGECSDWSVGKEISFFLRGEGNSSALAHTILFVRLLLAAALKEMYLQSITLQDNNLFRENLCHSLRRSV